MVDDDAFRVCRKFVRENVQAKDFMTIFLPMSPLSNSSTHISMAFAKWFVHGELEMPNLEM